MKKLRLGVIGAGSWTVSSHLPNLAKHGHEVEFAIVNRRNPELLSRIQAEFGFAKASTDWRDVIAEKPDIVVVGSPPSHHWEQSKAALEAGAHVLCEKPFTIDPAHAWDLEATARRTGRSLIIAYGWNYHPTIIQAHRMMDEEGGLGEIEHVSLHMDSALRELLSETGAYPDASSVYPPEPDTWSRPGTSGGGYGQAQLTHLLGVSLWLTGLQGKDVFAFMSAPLGANVELHDAVSIRYTNGAIGTMSGASSHLGAAAHRQAVFVRIVGSKGQLLVDLGDNFLSLYRPHEGDRRLPLELGAEPYDCKGPIDALVAAGTGAPFKNNSPAELGARVVEILEAAYRSAASGAAERIQPLS